ASGPTPPISAAPAAPGIPQAKPSSGTSGEATPPDADKAANATPPTPPPSGEGREATTTPLTLSDVQGLLSRISGGLVPPAANPQAAAKPTH
ncbi:MAG: hypothetical protein WBB34_02170, partial [Xanthobacteraceae bacterium]